MNVNFIRVTSIQGYLIINNIRLTLNQSAFMENLMSIRFCVTKKHNINIRNIFPIILKRWNLIVPFGIIGLSVGYIWIDYSPSNYKVSASFFVPVQSFGVEIGFEGLLPDDLINNPYEIFNQIEIIKSYYINEQVVHNLNWRTTWYSKDLFHWTAYYKDEPFHVEEMGGKINKSGIKLYIIPISNNQYKICAEGKAADNSDEKEFSFKSIGTFGIPFKNEFFHFIISRNQKPLIEEGRYFFTFNDLKQIAAVYKSNLDVKLNDGQSDLIHIQLIGDQPMRQIDYLNELIAVYKRNKINYQSGNQKQSLLFIEKQLEEISDSLDFASKNFSEFKSRNQIINLSKQGIQILNTLKEIEGEKNRNQMQLDYLYNLLDYMEQTPYSIYVDSPSIVGIQDATFNKIIHKLFGLISKRQIISFSSQDSNPNLLMIDKEIVQTYNALKENLHNLIRNTELLNKSLLEQIEYQNFQIISLPQKEQEFIKYQHRFERADETYTDLLHRKAEIELALAGATSRVQIIDQACIETAEVVGFSRRAKLLIGLLATLAFPGMFVWGSSVFSNTICHPEHLGHRTRFPILGNSMHTCSASPTPVTDHPDSVMAEAYRRIRVNLDFLLCPAEQKIISIHSVHPGEGKSFTAVNLSAILAMNNKEVILIGCDMHKPTLHQLFNTSNEHGLSTYLTGKDQVADIVFETVTDHLFFLPAGPCPANPSELMNRPHMAQLLKTLARDYDYVILDNAPLSLTTEGFISARHSNLNIVILRYGMSKKSQLKSINRLSANKRLDHIAFIINDMPYSEFGRELPDYLK